MEKKQIENNDLIEACIKNHSWAQTEIYKKYCKAMYNTALRVTNHKEDALEVMQESFFIAFTKIKQYNKEVSFGSWLKRIVINKSIDYIRRNRKIEIISWDENHDENDILDTVYFEEDEDKLKNIELIKQCMSQLHESYRIILSLKVFEGYDHDEISQILKISPSTSRSQLARAMKKLSEMVKTKKALV